MKSNFKASEKCTVCEMNKDGFVCFHHVYTRKAWPEFANEKFNLMPLCLWHHNEIHKMGTVSFSKKYSFANDWLIVNNWKLIMGKWMHLNYCEDEK
jgi:hypothetical protein